MKHLLHTCGTLVGFRVTGCKRHYVITFYSPDRVAELDRCQRCRRDLYDALRTGELRDVPAPIQSSADQRRSRSFNPLNHTPA